MNLTDNEIIKKFKEFIEYSRYNVGRKSTELLENILALIECKDVAIEVLKKDIDFQKADIERLKKFLDMSRKVSLARRDSNLKICELNLKLTEELKTARVEAIKEFAERLIKEYENIDGQYVDRVMLDIIDNLVKEMAGKDDAK